MDKPSLKPARPPANANRIGVLPPEEPAKSRINDGAIMRCVFYALIGFVSVTLWFDYQDLRQDVAIVVPSDLEPILPPYIPTTPGSEPATGTRPNITATPDQLRQPMVMQLKSNGVFEMTGSITAGIATSFEEAIADKQEYIRTIELNSPGGSVQDALAIAATIRANKWNTRVKGGALCASSCPLVFSGGAKRIAAQNAAIGIHQVFAVGEDNRSKPQVISGTQSMTATINRHLQEMDVDPKVWLHALETPPQNLYYLSSEELKRYKLATTISGNNS